MYVDGKKVEIGLDRLVIGLPYPVGPKLDTTKSITEEQLAMLQAHICAKNAFIEKMHYIQYMMATGTFKQTKSLNNGDIKRYTQLADSDGVGMCIFTLGFSYGTGVINFECNPSKLTTDHGIEIGALMGCLFADHYAELYGNAVVVHAEFFVDIHGVDFEDLVLITKGRNKVTEYMGTQYHGTRRSRHVEAMYNKAKELKISGQLVRVEARVNRRDIHFKDIVEQDLFNPLETVIVVKRSALQAASIKWKLPQLAGHVPAFGLYEAVFNKYARSSILAFLRERCVPWWQPALFWAAHRELLSHLMPGPNCVFEV